MLNCKSRLDSARNHVKQALAVTSHFWLGLLKLREAIIFFYDTFNLTCFIFLKLGIAHEKY